MEQKPLNCILLIDDDESSNFLHRLILEKSGKSAYIKTVDSGERALNYLQHHGEFKNNGTKYPDPDLIFLDINMPRMDGWEFLQEYEKLPQEHKGRTIIVMLTSSLNPDDEERAKQFRDVSGYLHKPLNPKSLEQILQEHFANRLK